SVYFSLPCGRSRIGTGARLRTVWRKPWGFESLRPQANPEKGLAPRAGAKPGLAAYARISPVSSSPLVRAFPVAGPRRVLNCGARDKGVEILQPSASGCEI